VIEASPARRRPPPTVVFAVVLLLAAAGCTLLVIATFVDDLIRVDALIDEAARTAGGSADEVAQARTTTRIADGIGIGVAVLMAGALAGTALWLLRGSHIGRVLGCVAAGVSAVCCCGTTTFGIISSQSQADSEFAAELSRLQADRAPAWSGLLFLAAALVVPLSSITALVLLVVPPSNRFFRPTAVTAAGGAWSPYEGYYYAYPTPTTPPPGSPPPWADSPPGPSVPSPWPPPPPAPPAEPPRDADR
jgi:hypothetical protein